MLNWLHTCTLLQEGKYFFITKSSLMSILTVHVSYISVFFYMKRIILKISVHHLYVCLFVWLVVWTCGCLYKCADKSLVRADWKNNWKVIIFRPTRRSLLPRRPGWTDSLLKYFWVACKS